MDFEEFVISGSRAIRHDLVNALFIAQAYNELEMDQSEKLQKISSQIEKAFSIIDVWKELEVFGEESSWQELKTLLLRAVAQSGRIASIDVNAKLKTNGLFYFVFTNLIDNSMRHGGKEGIKIRIYSKIEEGDLIIVCEDMMVLVFWKPTSKEYLLRASVNIPASECSSPVRLLS
jgi:hypothetical protein